MEAICATYPSETLILSFLLIILVAFFTYYKIAGEKGSIKCYIYNQRIDGFKAPKEVLDNPFPILALIRLL